MEENIFKTAKFGDKFVTRDGRTALYIYHYDGSDFGNELCVLGKDCGRRFLCYEDNGRFHCHECDEDIVGRRHEEVNTDELEHQATFYKECHLINGKMSDAIYDAFKAGYQKALNNFQ